jgi:Reverse transcriptase (RNA-dependent DNA polymerase)
MSEALAKLLDVKTAWKRVKDDARNRVFIRHPYAIQVVDLDAEGWLKARLEDVSSGRYTPASMFVCDVPKGKGLVRPGSHLANADRLVYAACVGACFPAIHAALNWAQGTVDFSYRLAKKASDAEWLRDRFTGWQEFREESIKKIDKGALYVVFADITAFYENVDIGILMSDLKQAGAPAAAIEQISRCLNKWAQVGGRGIPQGQSPSDILAKLYLNNVDVNLKNMGYDHLRYVDDIRIFCRSLVEAKKALVVLSRLLRKRGLSLQAAKSEIYRGGEARDEIEDVAVVLRGVKERFIQEVVRGTGFGDPYMSVPEADDILGRNPEDAPIEIIQETYQTYFADSSSEFNATLFRFLLNRLGKQRDAFGAEHCVTLLGDHPEETKAIVDYLARLDVPPDEAMIKFLNSDAAVYDYQVYLILEFYLMRKNPPPEALSSIARQLAFDAARPRYLKTVCRALLGKWGTAADLERLLDSYDEITDPSERGEAICALARLERTRRNTFLKRAEQDSEMNMRAAKWVRSLQDESDMVARSG